MSGSASTYSSGYLLVVVAAIALFLIIPAASASAHRLKPAWRAWVWPLVFGSLALTSGCGATATALGIQDYNSPLWKVVKVLASLSFTFLALNTLYRAIPETVARRFAPFLWLLYLLFVFTVIITNSFLPVLLYNLTCSILVFVVYTILYARDRDRATDAFSLMIGTGLIILADLVASFDFTVSLGTFTFTQLLPLNLLVGIALIFFLKGASASYSVKYDKQRSHDRKLSGQK
jgi:hypothetical protein